MSSISIGAKIALLSFKTNLETVWYVLSKEYEVPDVFPQFLSFQNEWKTKFKQAGAELCQAQHKLAVYDLAYTDTANC